MFLLKFVHFIKLRFLEPSIKHIQHKKSTVIFRNYGSVLTNTPNINRNFLMGVQLAIKGVHHKFFWFFQIYRWVSPKFFIDLSTVLLAINAITKVTTCAIGVASQTPVSFSIGGRSRSASSVQTGSAYTRR